jgi:hypothetical protein
MNYRLVIGKADHARIKRYFDAEPFVMQAAFAFAEIREHSGICTLHFTSFIALNESDYEYRTPGGMSFYSKVLLDILHGTSYLDKKSLIYLYSHGIDTMPESKNGDQELIFRISYAYMPFGLHASLLYQRSAIAGRIWLPKISTAPLDIIHE